MKILLVVCLLIYVIFTCDGIYNFLFGCGRKFKNGRKCKMWSCANKAECPFTAYKKEGE